MQKQKGRYLHAHLLADLKVPGLITTQHNIFFSYPFQNLVKVLVIFRRTPFCWYLNPQITEVFSSLGRLRIFGKDYTKEHVQIESQQISRYLFFFSTWKKQTTSGPTCLPGDWDLGWEGTTLGPQGSTPECLLIVLVTIQTSCVIGTRETSTCPSCFQNATNLKSITFQNSQHHKYWQIRPQKFYSFTQDRLKQCDKNGTESTRFTQLIAKQSN